MDISCTRYIKYQAYMYITNMLTRIRNYINKITRLKFSRCLGGAGSSNTFETQPTHRYFRDSQSHTPPSLAIFIREDNKLLSRSFHSFCRLTATISDRVLKIRNNNLPQKL